MSLVSFLKNVTDRQVILTVPREVLLNMSVWGVVCLFVFKLVKQTSKQAQTVHAQALVYLVEMFFFFLRLLLQHWSLDLGVCS